MEWRGPPRVSLNLFNSCDDNTINFVLTVDIVIIDWRFSKLRDRTYRG